MCVGVFTGVCSLTRSSLHFGRYSIHDDAEGADHANKVISTSIQTYCELTVPGEFFGEGGERTTYDVTDYVAGDFVGDPEFSLFDRFAKGTPDGDLPAVLKPRQVGSGGRLAKKSLRLQALAYVRTPTLRASARCMEAQECDATTKACFESLHPNAPPC